MRLPSSARRGLCAALLAAALAGCQFAGGRNPGGCASDQECQRACDTAADCCPSQICIPQHICQDKYTVCTTGPTARGTCGLAGQVCKAIGVHPPETAGCTWEKCGAGGA